MQAISPRVEVGLGGYDRAHDDNKRSAVGLGLLEVAQAQREFEQNEGNHLAGAVVEQQSTERQDHWLKAKGAARVPGWPVLQGRRVAGPLCLDEQVHV